MLVKQEFTLDIEDNFNTPLKAKSTPVEIHNHGNGVKNDMSSYVVAPKSF